MEEEEGVLPSLPPLHPVVAVSVDWLDWLPKYFTEGAMAASVSSPNGFRVL